MESYERKAFVLRSKMQYRASGMGRGKALAWLTRNWATRDRKLAISILQRGSSAHDICLWNCCSLWNYVVTSCCPLQGTVWRMVSIYHQSSVGSSWRQLVTHCARSLDHLGSRKFLQWVLSGIAEAGLILSIFRVSILSNDWQLHSLFEDLIIMKG
jgi:hypothetical protein